MNAPPESEAPSKTISILHCCQRQLLRPLRDQLLRLCGYAVESADSREHVLELFEKQPYDLVLIDVEGEAAIREAESLCAELKTARSGQLVAFVCNWRVAILSDCPDDIVRTEFNPEAFLNGVKDVLTSHQG